MKLELFGDRRNGFAALGQNDLERVAPCPFCGSPDVQIANTHTPSYWAYCPACRAEGPKPALPRRVACRTVGAVRRQHQRAFTSALRAWNERKS